MNSSNEKMNYFTDSNLGCVIVTSDEPWSDVWMPQLHYAFQLSKRFNVVFLGPPKKWSIKSLFKLSQVPKRYNDRLVMISYLNVLPLSLGKISVFVNDKINQLLIKRKITENFQLPDLILWRFDPFRSMFLFDNKSVARQIFHVIDPIAGCDLDIPLSRRAELVIITSPKFIDHYKSLNNNVVQISQGVDLDFYSNQLPSDHEVRDISKDSVLLLGSFTDDIDYIFLKKLSEHISAKLILIGPKKISKPAKELNFKFLIDNENVHWLGPMEPSRFLGYLENCKVGIISYDNDNNLKNKLRSPLKAIGYLAAHKCIISNIDCEIPALLDKAIYVVPDEDTYFRYIDKCFEGTLYFDQDAVDKYLSSIDYNNLISLIFKKLGEPLPPIL